MTFSIDLPDWSFCTYFLIFMTVYHVLCWNLMYYFETHKNYIRNYEYDLLVMLYLAYPIGYPAWCLLEWVFNLLFYTVLLPAHLAKLLKRNKK